MNQNHPRTIRAVKQQYDAWAENYDATAEAWSYSGTSKLANRLSHLLSPSMLVADLACGTGRNWIEYKAQSPKFIGIDISYSMLKAAPAQPRVQADMARLPFIDNSFDASICTAALEHFHNKDVFINEMQRIVKQGGYIAFTVPSTDIGLHSLSRSGVVALVERAGLPLEELFTFRSHYESGWKPVHFWAVIGRNKK